MQDADDAALARAARTGDRAAFATLVGRHYTLLLAVCRRMLGDAGGAEDAAQEATLQALLAVGELRRPERFGPWLAGIGLNVCRRGLRGRSRDAWSWEALCGGILFHEPVADGPDPAGLALEAELRARVRDAVATLPRGQRAAVTLYYLQGLTHREAAAQLGIPAGAVKTRLHKARGALRRELAPLWEEKGMVAATETGTGMVEVRIADVRRSPSKEDGSRACVVLLEEVGGAPPPRQLPIWIGEPQGEAIALALEGVAPPRPLTYAFMAGVLGAAGGRLRDVRVTRLAADVFYATATIDGPDDAGREVDARPSDAFGLVLAAGAPILVATDVLEAVRHTTTPPTGFAMPDDSWEGAAGIAAALKVATGVGSGRAP